MIRFYLKIKFLKIAYIYKKWKKIIKKLINLHNFIPISRQAFLEYYLSYWKKRIQVLIIPIIIIELFHIILFLLINIINNRHISWMFHDTSYVHLNNGTHIWYYCIFYIIIFYCLLNRIIIIGKILFSYRLLLNFAVIAE